MQAVHRETGWFINGGKFIHFSGLDRLSVFYCDYDHLRYSRCLFDELEVSFPENFDDASTKRQAEYLAGRYAAASALKRLGVTNPNISSGKNREPCWPAGIVGSITHKTSVAVSVAAKRDSANLLGIDYEEWVSYPTFQRIESRIINQKEHALLEMCDYSKEEAFTIAFSAKESLFKALYPFVGRYFGFSAAEVTGISKFNNSFELTLCETLNPELPKGRRFKGRLLADTGGVLTLIAA